jgi:hypothetical protein
MTEDGVSNHGHDKACWRWIVTCGLLFGCAACTLGDKQVASACKNGVCPGALTSEAPVCIPWGVDMDIGAPEDDAGLPLDVALTEACLRWPLPKNEQGEVLCRVVRRDLTTQGPADCAKVISFAHVSDTSALDTSYAPWCTVPQIEKPASDAGSAAGWYYDDHVGREDCQWALYFTHDAGPRVGRDIGVEETLQCSAAIVVAGSKDIVDEGAECTLPADSAQHVASVGDSCTPVAKGPMNDYYLETGAPDCDTGVCLSDSTKGDYCTCRCDSPDGKGDCECPHGFVCYSGPLVLGPEPLRGSYCVRTK